MNRIRMNLFELELKNTSLKLLRFICLKQLNKNKKDCADFEVRFCCSKSSFENVTGNRRERRTAFNRTEPEKPKLENLPNTRDDLRNFIEKSSRNLNNLCFKYP